MAERHYITDSEDVHNLKSALAHLEHAEDLLLRVGAVRAAERARTAMTSAKRALRTAKSKGDQECQSSPSA